MLAGIALASAGLWLAVLLVPWRPWSTRERLEPVGDESASPYPLVTVLIPARNEAATIGDTILSVLSQAPVKRVIVVDDQSSDGTGEIARAIAGVKVIEGTATPPEWSGKLWALEQGKAEVETPLLLLLDADIELAPGMVAALVDKLESGQLDQVSIMASLPAGLLPEKLMLPAFVYFFKQLYPFAWVNRPDRPFAAAAGGCVLVRCARLREAGGFGAWKNALIDDCELATRIRRVGGRIWLGLSQGVKSMRRHPDFGSILETIRRTAYTQLHYSPVLLALTVTIMLLAFAVPPLAFAVGAIQGDLQTLAFAALAWLLMAAGYLPQIRFAGLNPLWAFTLPIAALLFVLATLDSALRHHFGGGAGWKGRQYSGNTD